MDERIIKFIDSIEFGECQTYEHMTIVPLLISETSGSEYLTFGQAQTDGLVSIRYDSDDDAYTNLSVENKSNQPVLFLDTEEVTDGNESFCFNSTVLLKANSVTTLPFSPTAYSGSNIQSIEFFDSGIMLPPTVRAQKMIMVSDDLLKYLKYNIKELDVESFIDKLSKRLGSNPEEVEERIKSLKEIYDFQFVNLGKYESAFHPVPNQKGLVVIINNRVIGFDLFSSEKAYSQHVSRLVKSFALNALSVTKEENYVCDGDKMAEEFFMEVKRLEQKRYKSFGCGFDIRFTDRVSFKWWDIGSIEGTALEVDGTIIHLSFIAIRHLPDCSSCPPPTNWDLSN